MIVRLLKQYGIDKSDALMVGDLYKWDYKPAQDAGVDAVLLERPYSYKDYEKLDSIKVIHKLNELEKYL